MSSFFLVSTEITGLPRARHLRTAVPICRNCASRSGWVSPFLGLAVALEAVVQFVKKLRHFRMADRVTLQPQFLRNGPRAHANPPQRRLRVATRLLIDHLFQTFHQVRIGNRNWFPAGAGTANATGRWRDTFCDLPDTLRNRLPRQSTGTTHETYSPIAQSHRFTGRHDTPCPFVQEWPNGMEFLSQLGKSAHAEKHSRVTGELLSSLIYADLGTAQKLFHI